MKVFLSLVLALTMTACVSVPDVYLIDRHTVMELEASGEWPELENRFREKALNSGSLDIPDAFAEQRKEKVFTMLQGEFVEDSTGAQQ